MQKKVIIIGASGHARVIADIVKQSGDDLVGFLDDKDEIQNNIVFDGKIVLGKITDNIVSKYKDCYFIVGIGNNEIRKNITNRFSYLNWYTAIHPNAVIGNNVSIGKGSVIMAGVVVNTGTKIGNHCIINTSSSLDHDNILSDFVHVSPGAHLCGTVSIGECTWICSGVTVINNIRIERNNVIGAGAVVIRDINDTNSTYFGVPARKIK